MINLLRRLFYQHYCDYIIYSYYVKSQTYCLKGSKGKFITRYHIYGKRKCVICGRKTKKDRKIKHRQTLYQIEKFFNN